MQILLDSCIFWQINLFTVFFWNDALNTNQQAWKGWISKGFLLHSVNTIPLPLILLHITTKVKSMYVRILYFSLAIIVPAMSFLYNIILRILKKQNIKKTKVCPIQDRNEKQNVWKIVSSSLKIPMKFLLKFWFIRWIQSHSCKKMPIVS